MKKNQKKTTDFGITKVTQEQQFRPSRRRERQFGLLRYGGFSTCPNHPLLVEDTVMMVSKAR